MSDVSSEERWRAKASQVATSDDFGFFLEAVLESLEESPDEWAAISLEEFLQRLSEVVGDSERTLRECSSDEAPTWSYAARILVDSLKRR